MAEAFHISTGAKISGAAHAVLILWAIAGGLFSFKYGEPLEVAEVTLISGDQLAAMMAAGSPTPDVSTTPATPEAPETAETPDVPPPEAAPEAAETPESAAEVTPEETPAVEDTFELPQAEVEPVAPAAPAQPEVPDGASTVLAPENAPAPQAAPRVAPQPADRPDPDATVSEDVQEATRPDEAPAPVPQPVEPQEATAPEEAATEIVTEATEAPGGTVVALAPTGSPRPARRPNRPAPQPVSQPAESPAEDPAAAEPPADPSADATADAIAAAVAEAASSETPGSGSAPTGPPLTSGEKDALRISVQRCWNVGALSTEALGTTVTVFVAMKEDGTPDNSSIRMLGFEGGSEEAAGQAFAAARRAVIRCGSKGFDLPNEKYSQWREIEMVFNPEKMRIK